MMDILHPEHLKPFVVSYLKGSLATPPTSVYTVEWMSSADLSCGAQEDHGQGMHTHTSDVRARPVVWYTGSQGSEG